MSPEREPNSSRLSVATLIVASLSSLAAALVVSRVSGSGTLVGAAVTPIIVALASEALHRPARAVSTVRATRATRFDPVAEGRRGLREGDLERAHPAQAGETAERRVHRPTRERPALRRPRKGVLLAVATGLVAFAVAGVLLTGSELVLGSSSVSAPAKRTTLFGGSSSEARTDDAGDARTTTTGTATTEATPTTTAPTVTGTTPTTPPEGVAPPGGTMPPGTPVPAPATPAPPTSATATTPAPGGTPAPTPTTP